MLVAPEWRLSLELKYLELWGQRGDLGVDATLRSLQALFQLPFLDVLDECDELLHHRCVPAPTAAAGYRKPSLCRSRSPGRIRITDRAVAVHLACWAQIVVLLPDAAGTS